jgi:hypothetical protein
VVSPFSIAHVIPLNLENERSVVKLKILVVFAGEGVPETFSLIQAGRSLPMMDLSELIG